MRTQKKYNNPSNAAPNTGELLKTYFKQKRIRKAALARLLNRSSNTLVTFVKNETIQTAVLWEISNALKHNFFMDIAVQLPATYSVNVPPDTSKDERISQLEQEVALLKAEKQVLIEVAKR